MKIGRGVSGEDKEEKAEGERKKKGRKEQKYKREEGRKDGQTFENHPCSPPECSVDWSRR